MAADLDLQRQADPLKLPFYVLECGQAAKKVLLPGDARIRIRHLAVSNSGAAVVTPVVITQTGDDPQPAADFTAGKKLIVCPQGSYVDRQDVEMWGHDIAAGVDGAHEISVRAMANTAPMIQFEVIPSNSRR